MLHWAQLSLGELQPALVEVSTNEKIEKVVAETGSGSGTGTGSRPRKLEAGKKTIFDELKDLDEAIFENQVKKIFFIQTQQLT